MPVGVGAARGGAAGLPDQTGQGRCHENAVPFERFPRSVCSLRLSAHDPRGPRFEVFLMPVLGYTQDSGKFKHLRMVRTASCVSLSRVLDQGCRPNEELVRQGLQPALGTGPTSAALATLTRASLKLTKRTPEVCLHWCDFFLILT